jgi:hypothetical protein
MSWGFRDREQPRLGATPTAAHGHHPPIVPSGATVLCFHGVILPFRRSGSNLAVIGPAAKSRKRHMSEKRSPFRDVLKLEKDLGLPGGWYFSLVAEKSDWAFVLKLHALFEAALTHLIEAKLNLPELRRYLDRLNMGGRSGKLALAVALNVIEQKHVRFIEALSTIRNYCIHDVRNVAFVFGQYLKDLDSDTRKNLFSAFQPLLIDQLPIGKDETVPREEYIQRETLLAFWHAATIVLAEMYVEKELAELLKKQQSVPSIFTDIYGTGEGLLTRLMRGAAASPTTPNDDGPR